MAVKQYVAEATAKRLIDDVMNNNAVWNKETGDLISGNYCWWLSGPVGPLSPDTEYFTGTGWRRIDSYDGGQIGVVDFSDPDNPTLTLETPLDHIVTPARDMHRIHNKHSLDMALSSCHKVPYYNTQGEFKVCQAGDIVDHPSNRRIPVNFSVPYQDQDITDDRLRLLVAVNADGSLAKSYPRSHRRGETRAEGKPTGGVNIVVRKQRKKDRIVQLLNLAGVEFSHNEDKRGDCRYGFNMPEYTSLPKDYSDPFWWNLSTRQLGVVLDELQHWDGLYETSESRFYSKNKIDAEFVQYAAHACGLRATISHTVYSNHWSDTYIVYITTKPQAVRVRVDNTQIEEYKSPDGKQYCFQTTKGYFLARYNGKVFITGNSGKTSIISILMSLICQYQKPFNNKRKVKFAIVRSSYKNIEETVLFTMQDWIPGIKIRRGNRPSARWDHKMPDGTWIEAEFVFYSMDRPEEVEDLRGTEFTFAWLNEGTEVPGEVLEIFYGRIGRSPSMADGGPTRTGIIIDSNMPIEGTYLPELFDIKQPPGHIKVVQPAALLVEPDPNGEYRFEGKQVNFLPNPEAENVENVDGGVGYHMRQLNANDDFIRRNLLNKYGLRHSGKGVYSDDFVEHIHIHKGLLIPERHHTLLVGIDWGLSPGVVITYMDDYGLKVCENICPEDTVLEQLMELYVKPALAARYPHHYETNQILFIGDPAGRNRESNRGLKAYRELTGMGFHVILAPTNDIQRRVSSVKKVLKTASVNSHNTEPRLLVSNQAVELIEGFQGKYYYKQKRGTDEYHEIPCKDHPHSDVVNALEYVTSAIEEGMHEDHDPAALRIPTRRQNYNYG